MRAAHSLKGAARIVGLAVGVRVAHAMEDCFVAAQQGQLTLRQAHIDLLLGATDLLARIAHTAEAEIGQWDGEKKPEVDAALAALAGLLAGRCAVGGRSRRRAADGSAPTTPPTSPTAPIRRARTRLGPRAARVGGEPESPAEPGRRVAGRIALGQAVRRVAAAAQAAAPRARARRSTIVRDARAAIAPPDEPAQAALAQAQRRVVENEQFLAQRLVELEMFDRRSHQSGAPPLRRGARLPHAAVRRRRRGLSAHGARSRALARQAGAARHRRRRHAGGPRHSGEARSAARPSAAQRRRSRHRVAGSARRRPASRRGHSSGSKRVTAPARCRSSCPTTAAASISRSCARPSSRGS